MDSATGKKKEAEVGSDSVSVKATLPLGHCTQRPADLLSCAEGQALIPLHQPLTECRQVQRGYSIVR